MKLVTMVTMQQPTELAMSHDHRHLLVEYNTRSGKTHAEPKPLQV